MLNQPRIPDQCIIDREINKKEFFDGSKLSLAKFVRSISWYASLKPGFISAKPVRTSEIAYEEIQVFQVEITNSEKLFSIAAAFYKKVRYPCILIMKFGAKYCVGACPFTVGKIDSDKNILKNQAISHWIHPDLLSPGASKLISAINQSIETGNDLQSIYTRIYHAVLIFQLGGGITKVHVDRLLWDLLGRNNCPESKRNEILKYCTPHKRYMPTDDSLAAKYDGSKRTSSYIYSYDIEDIWYCLMQYAPTKKIIASRRYRDIEDLVYCIDSKYLDSEEGRFNSAWISGLNRMLQENSETEDI